MTGYTNKALHNRSAGSPDRGILVHLCLAASPSALPTHTARLALQSQSLFHYAERMQFRDRDSSASVYARALDIRTMCAGRADGKAARKRLTTGLGTLLNDKSA